MRSACISYYDLALSEPNMSELHPTDSFDSLRRDVERLRGLQHRVAALLATRRPTAFDGLGDFLDHVLPIESDQVEQIGRALKIYPGQLTSLRHSELDPCSLPLEGFVEFAQCVGLDEGSLVVLIDRDHGRYKRAQQESFARGSESPTRDNIDIGARVRATWERILEDDPTGL